MADVARGVVGRFTHYLRSRFRLPSGDACHVARIRRRMCEQCKKPVGDNAIKIHKFKFHPTCFSVFLTELNEKRRKQAEEDAKKAQTLADKTSHAP